MVGGHAHGQRAIAVAADLDHIVDVRLVAKRLGERGTDRAARVLVGCVERDTIRGDNANARAGRLEQRGRRIQLRTDR